jgi:multidrug transporter EmrE-like cation transporter
VSRGAALVVLFLAALLEAGGDAVLRTALHTSAIWPRALLLALGGALLVGYGLTVNAPPWDFGQLLGLYVVFFFVIAQVISWIGFRQPPSAAVMIGGGLIVTGGLVIALAKP